MEEVILKNLKLQISKDSLEALFGEDYNKVYKDKDNIYARTLAGHINTAIKLSNTLKDYLDKMQKYDKDYKLYNKISKEYYLYYTLIGGYLMMLKLLKDGMSKEEFIKEFPDTKLSNIIKENTGLKLDVQKLNDILNRFNKVLISERFDKDESVDLFIKYANEIINQRGGVSEVKETVSDTETIEEKLEELQEAEQELEQEAEKEAEQETETEKEADKSKSVSREYQDEIKTVIYDIKEGREEFFNALIEKVNEEDDDVFVNFNVLKHVLEAIQYEDLNVIDIVKEIIEEKIDNVRKEYDKKISELTKKIEMQQKVIQELSKLLNEHVKITKEINEKLNQVNQKTEKVKMVVEYKAEGKKPEEKQETIKKPSVKRRISFISKDEYTRGSTRGRI
ncbi:MAG: hypothetical protein KatS3mg096_617 [Candidatus Parcubacteria bacterium]|nr:MAG: hypothetical protein KatS3mg096_617 [Candidatus Parcubacteria bacterium]